MCARGLGGPLSGLWVAVLTRAIRVVRPASAGAPRGSRGLRVLRRLVCGFEDVRFANGEFAMHAANDPVAAVRPHLPIMAVNKSTSLHRIIDHANDVIGVRVVCVESIISYLRS